MSAPDDGSYLSRFLLKFVEIIAAGVATAVSGYLIAHLSGVLSSPAPTGAAIQGAPAANVQSSLPAQPITPTSGDASERRVAPQEGAHAAAVSQPAAPSQEVNASPVVQPAHSSANTTKMTAARKHSETATSAAESKRDQESFVARVRSALGNADRTDSIDAHQSGVSRGPATMTPPPASSGAVASAPSGATELRPATVQQGSQQAPLEPNPLTTVEINSRPATAAQSSPAASPVTEIDGLSPLEQMLRHDPLTGTNDAPRPPMPVGQ
jgi:hypothetical protein